METRASVIRSPPQRVASSWWRLGWPTGGSFLGGGLSDPGIMYNNGQPPLFLLGVKFPGISNPPNAV